MTIAVDMGRKATKTNKQKSVVFLLCFRARQFIVALWSPAGKEPISCHSFVTPYCEIVTFPLVSRVWCGI